MARMRKDQVRAIVAAVRTRLTRYPESYDFNTVRIPTPAPRAVSKAGPRNTKACLLGWAGYYAHLKFGRNFFGALDDVSLALFGLYSSQFYDAMDRYSCDTGREGRAGWMDDASVAAATLKKLARAVE